MRGLCGLLAAFFIATLFLHVRSVGMVAGMCGAFAFAIGTLWLSTRRRQPAALHLVSSLVLAIAFSRAVSSFVFGPLLTVALMQRLAGVPWVRERWWALAGWAFLAGLGSFALEAVGLLTQLWELLPDGGLLVSSGMFGTTATTSVLRVAMVFAFYLGIIQLARSVARRQRAARHRLRVRNWHLRRLLPRGTVTGA